MIFTIDMASGEEVEEVKAAKKDVKVGDKRELDMPSLDLGLQQISIAEPSLEKMKMPESLARENLDSFIGKMK